ncbi:MULTISPECIES: N-acetylglucosamine-binding protein GbpA [Pseudomonas]|uniref:N-acetylglucosamine-binding protein GbpA n=1 Tax=Pseudomonadaceae TaxID=135621 RepID=UPI00084A5DA5|nr:MULTISPECIES: N-acetylglucosamine-binding protein GbpA [Pseudomonas]OEC52413.1 multidrug transporter [Pseudomonas sp. ENNP23]
MRKQSLRKLPLALAIGLATLASQQAIAHGYIESPQSRSFMCASNGGSLNAKCGGVQYEPQSVEYTPAVNHHLNGKWCGGTFQECGPAEGTIAAGGLQRFSELNEQTATRWHKTTIKPGMQDFTWFYTQGHATAYWQFYITKKDWNPNQPLTRDSFEATPIAHEQFTPGVHETPQRNGRSVHRVNVPADRSGYHVILATWRVGDTDATFYQAIDVNIDNDQAGGGETPPPAPEWNLIGAVQPEQLNIGDTVTLRAFDKSSQLSTVELKIANAEQAQANTWPFLLAKKVNAGDYGYKLGELNTAGEIVPNYGRNGIHVKADSKVTRVEIQKDQPTIPGSLSLTGLSSSYQIKDGKTDLHFNAIAQGGEYQIKATVLNTKGETVAHKEAAPGNTPHFHMALNNVEAGAHDLVVVATPKKGELLQQTHRFTLIAEPGNGGGENPGEGGGENPGNGDYDFVFPDGVQSYKAGTTVLAKDGNTYECLPFPASGYCKQWTSGSTQFEPGKGTHWDMAWKRK